MSFQGDRIPEEIVEGVSGPLLFTRSSSQGPKAFSPRELQAVKFIALWDCLCLPLLLKHFCSSIFGHELVKMGLLLALFGGTHMNSSGSIITIIIIIILPYKNGYYSIIFQSHYIFNFLLLLFFIYL